MTGPNTDRSDCRGVQFALPAAGGSVWLHVCYLASVLPGLVVEAAYPAAVQLLVVLRRSLHPLEVGAVAGLQAGGLLTGGLLTAGRRVLGLGSHGSHRLHVSVGLKLRPKTPQTQIITGQSVGLKLRPKTPDTDHHWPL